MKRIKKLVLSVIISIISLAMLLGSVSVASAIALTGLNPNGGNIGTAETGTNYSMDNATRIGQVVSFLDTKSYTYWDLRTFKKDYDIVSAQGTTVSAPSYVLSDTTTDGVALLRNNFGEADKTEGDDSANAVITLAIPDGFTESATVNAFWMKNDTTIGKGSIAVDSGEFKISLNMVTDVDGDYTVNTQEVYDYIIKWTEGEVTKLTRLLVVNGLYIDQGSIYSKLPLMAGNTQVVPLPALELGVNYFGIVGEEDNEVVIDPTIGAWGSILKQAEGIFGNMHPDYTKDFNANINGDLVYTVPSMHNTSTTLVYKVTQGANSVEKYFTLYMEVNYSQQTLVNLFKVTSSGVSANIYDGYWMDNFLPADWSLKSIAMNAGRGAVVGNSYFVGKTPTYQDASTPAYSKYSGAAGQNQLPIILKGGEGASFKYQPLLMDKSVFYFDTVNGQNVGDKVINKYSLVYTDAEDTNNKIILEVTDWPGVQKVTVFTEYFDGTEIVRTNLGFEYEGSTLNNNPEGWFATRLGIDLVNNKVVRGIGNSQLVSLVKDVEGVPTLQYQGFESKTFYMSIEFNDLVDDEGEAILYCIGIKSLEIGDGNDSQTQYYYSDVTNLHTAGGRHLDNQTYLPLSYNPIVRFISGYGANSYPEQAFNKFVPTMKIKNSVFSTLTGESLTLDGIIASSPAALLNIGGAYGGAMYGSCYFNATNFPAIADTGDGFSANAYVYADLLYTYLNAAAKLGNSCVLPVFELKESTANLTAREQTVLLRQLNDVYNATGTYRTRSITFAKPGTYTFYVWAGDGYQSTTKSAERFTHQYTALKCSDPACTQMHVKLDDNNVSSYDSASGKMLITITVVDPEPLTASPEAISDGAGKALDLTANMNIAGGNLSDPTITITSIVDANDVEYVASNANYVDATPIDVSDVTAVTFAASGEYIVTYSITKGETITATRDVSISNPKITLEIVGSDYPTSVAKGDVLTLVLPTIVETLNGDVSWAIQAYEVDANGIAVSGGATIDAVENEGVYTITFDVKGGTGKYKIRFTSTITDETDLESYQATQSITTATISYKPLTWVMSEGAKLVEKTGVLNNRIVLNQTYDLPNLSQYAEYGFNATYDITIYKFETTDATGFTRNTTVDFDRVTFTTGGKYTITYTITDELGTTLTHSYNVQVNTGYSYLFETTGTTQIVEGFALSSFVRAEDRTAASAAFVERNALSETTLFQPITFIMDEGDSFSFIKPFVDNAGVSFNVASYETGVAELELLTITYTSTQDSRNKIILYIVQSANLSTYTAVSFETQYWNGEKVVYSLLRNYYDNTYFTGAKDVTTYTKPGTDIVYDNYTIGLYNGSTEAHQLDVAGTIGIQNNFANQRDGSGYFWHITYDAVAGKIYKFPDARDDTKMMIDLNKVNPISGLKVFDFGGFAYNEFTVDFEASQVTDGGKARIGVIAAANGADTKTGFSMQYLNYRAQPEQISFSPLNLNAYYNLSNTTTWAVESSMPYIRVPNRVYMWKTTNLGAVPPIYTIEGSETITAGLYDFDGIFASNVITDITGLTMLSAIRNGTEDILSYVTVNTFDASLKSGLWEINFLQAGLYTGTYEFVFQATNAGGKTVAAKYTLTVSGLPNLAVSAQKMNAGLDQAINLMGNIKPTGATGEYEVEINSITGAEAGEVDLTDADFTSFAFSIRDIYTVNYSVTSGDGFFSTTGSFEVEIDKPSIEFEINLPSSIVNNTIQLTSYSFDIPVVISEIDSYLDESWILRVYEVDEFGIEIDDGEEFIGSYSVAIEKFSVAIETASKSGNFVFEFSNTLTEASDLEVYNVNVIWKSDVVSLQALAWKQTVAGTDDINAMMLKPWVSDKADGRYITNNYIELPQILDVVVGGVENAATIEVVSSNSADAVVTADTIKFNVAGDYTLRYSVTDKIGNTIYKEVTVKALPGYDTLFNTNGSVNFAIHKNITDYILSGDKSQIATGTISVAGGGQARPTTVVMSEGSSIEFKKAFADSATIKFDLVSTVTGEADTKILSFIYTDAVETRNKFIVYMSHVGTKKVAYSFELQQYDAQTDTITYTLFHNDQDIQFDRNGDDVVVSPRTGEAYDNYNVFSTDYETGYRNGVYPYAFDNTNDTVHISKRSFSMGLDLMYGAVYSMSNGAAGGSWKIVDLADLGFSGFESGKFNVAIESTKTAEDKNTILGLYFVAYSGYYNNEFLSTQYVFAETSAFFRFAQSLSNWHTAYGTGANGTYTQDNGNPVIRMPNRKLSYPTGTVANMPLAQLDRGNVTVNLGEYNFDNIYAVDLMGNVTNLQIVEAYKVTRTIEIINDTPVEVITRGDDILSKVTSNFDVTNVSDNFSIDFADQDLGISYYEFILQATSDSSARVGGTTSKARLIVNVVDLPTITVTQPGDVSVGVEYTLPVATITSADSYTVTVTDSLGAEVTVVDGKVTFTEIGTYTATYYVENMAGSDETSIQLVVVDDVAPVISIVEDQSAEAGVEFTLPIAEVTDNYDSDLVATVTVEDSEGTLQTITDGKVTLGVGTYTIKYNVSDSAENDAIEVTATLTVSDTTAPVIADLESQEAQAGVEFTIPVISATDLVDGTLTVTFTVVDSLGNQITVTNGKVTLTEIGTYTIVYYAIDAAGNDTTKEVTLSVLDTTAPVIGSVGNQTTDEGVDFTLPVPSVTDNFDTGLVATITVVNAQGQAQTITNGKVNLTAGIYTIKYNVADAAGNNAVEVTATLTVLDKTAPVIATVANQTAEVNAEFSLPIPNVTDNVDTGLVATITVENAQGQAQTITNGKVTLAIGTYTIKYNVTDTAGNNAVEVTATLTVSDTTAPVISFTMPKLKVAVNTDVTLPSFAVNDNSGETIVPVVQCSGGISIVNNKVKFTKKGNYTITITATDSTGNVSTETYVYEVVSSCKANSSAIVAGLVVLAGAVLVGKKK